jgi:23S rRNA (cytidine1920-2'-O)/16S rRNA (cytidine1409-2'-O)-methyltransferase
LTKLKKERLDILLVEKGIFPTREKAKSAIMAGEVLVEGERVKSMSKEREQLMLVHLQGVLVIVS